MPSTEELDGLTNEIRLRRLSRAPSALFPGVDAIAAPVFDYRNNLVAVVCVVARSEAQITGWDGSAVRALTDVAAQLSARFGFTGADGKPSQPTRGGEVKATKPVKAVAERRSDSSSHKRGGV